MFEQSFLGDAAGSKRSWSVAGSALGQTALIGVAALLPLIFTHQLPVDEWALHTVLFAPPAPPQPPPPPTVKAQQLSKPQRFEEMLRQPTAMPDQVALVHDRSPRVALSVQAPGGVVGAVTGLAEPDLASINFVPMPPTTKPIPIGGNIQSARLLKRVAPEYPEEARKENITGTVVLRAIIDKSGAVRDLELLEGHPLLAPSAIVAVGQWLYRPTKLNGQAVEVVTRVEVQYTLTAPVDPKELRKQQRRERRETKR